MPLKNENPPMAGFFVSIFSLSFDKPVYNIRRLEIPLYRYRRHENNMTNDAKTMKEHEKLLSLKHGL